MKRETPEDVIGRVVEQLCASESYRSISHHHQNDVPLPSVDALAEMMRLTSSVLFPDHFGPGDLVPETACYHVGAMLDRIAGLAVEQFKRGFCFNCPLCEAVACDMCEERARTITTQLLERLPEIRRLLALDVRAAFDGDPAGKNADEIIFCYPSIKALAKHRVAHELYRLEVPIIPRIISEMAHSETGIDIHPGAQIGESFFMDHGTGVVIGETAVVGRDVRLYQGVTLGAKSFPLDAHGNPIKGVPRHPIVEDDVIIYAGATLLGSITIGRGSVMGGNVWLTRSVPPGSRVLQSPAEEMTHADGSGI
jgi:serine O-acetyltransferase